MAEVNLLEKVKTLNGFTGTYQDDLIQSYIDEVKEYLMDGGVQKEIVDAPTSVGVIARGVSDLYYDDSLSNYFRERVIQLSMKEVTENV